jgi:hypothetical protein
MLLNQGQIAPHADHRTSVLKLIYKHLPSNNILHLKAGNELILVIPVLVDKVMDDRAAVHDIYGKSFTKMADNTLRPLHPGNQELLVYNTICDCHMLPQEDSPFLEFACCVQNYAEHDFFESKLVDTQAADLHWQQGAGLALSICGYSTQSIVMVQFRHVGYLKVYGRIRSKSFLRDSIRFNNNIHDVSKLDAALIEQLSMYDGCRFRTMEVLWKYYCAIVAANQCKRSGQQSREAAAAREGHADKEDQQNQQSRLCIITNTIQFD